MRTIALPSCRAAGRVAIDGSDVRCCCSAARAVIGAAAGCRRLPLVAYSPLLACAGVAREEPCGSAPFVRPAARALLARVSVRLRRHAHVHAFTRAALRLHVRRRTAAACIAVEQRRHLPPAPARTCCCAAEWNRSTVRAIPGEPDQREIERERGVDARMSSAHVLATVAAWTLTLQSAIARCTVGARAIARATCATICGDCRRRIVGRTRDARRPNCARSFRKPAPCTCS